MSPRSKTLVAAAALAAWTAIPAPVAGDNGWIRLETASFTLVSNADEAAVRRVGADLERLRDVIGQLTGARLDSPVPTILYLFRDDASYAPYRLSGQPVDAPGYLVPHEHAVYGVLNGDPGHRATPIVYRQYILRLLNEGSSKLPLWLSYGAAELFSAFVVHEGQARIGLPISGHLFWLQQNPPMPVAALFARETLPAGKDFQSFTMRSWLLVHYLLIGNAELRQRVPEYLRVLARGTSPAAAWRQVFAVEPDALEAALVEYVKGDTFSYLPIPVTAAADLGAETYPLAEHETLFHLGDLLVHTAPERHADAAELFRRAVELTSEHGPSWGGLGYSSELVGDHEAARAHYEKAAAHSPDDPLLQYLYGESLLRALGGQRPSGEEATALLGRARDAMERATRLDPDFAQAWVRLGYAHSLEHRPSPAEVETLETAARLLPRRADVAFNLLLAYARAGDRGQAEATRQRLDLLQADAAILARAREIVLQLEFREGTELMRQDRLDDAVAVLAHVQASTRDPDLAERAAEYLGTAAKASRHNRFVEPYNRAVRLLEAGDLEAAVAAIEELAADARPGRQAEAVASLRERLAELRSQ
ncbi:MAG TPA: tetratricopeptide repeat protein [Thermoanaerobaculia bacterium]|jgi:Flp pilus assembly protein TadD